MQEKNAWVRYVMSTGEILEITFNRNHGDTEIEGWIECQEKIALDFLSGKLLLNDHTVSKDENGNTTVVLKTSNINTRNFWDLCDAESDDSPVRITDKTNDGFKVFVKDDNQDITVYVTMKNDPNYLFKILRLTDKNKKGVDHWYVPLKYEKDYSIYVRYHVTRN